MDESSSSDENSLNIKCPICQNEFPNAVINKHVNECLNITEKKSNCKELRKRKSDSAWGSLQPQQVHAPNKKLKVENSKTFQSKKSKVIFNKNNKEKDDQKESSFSSEDDEAKKVIDITEEEKPLDEHCQQTEHESVESKNTLISNKNCQNSISTLEKNKQQNGNISLKTQPVSQPSQASATKSVGLSSQQNVLPVFGASIGLKKSQDFIPLAERMRPRTMDEYMGQDQAVGRKSLLRSLLLSDSIPSMVLWGPPGCGKTSLARIIANKCKEKGGVKFVQLSATTSGVNDVKEVIKVAKNDQRMLKRKTILFLDEIHRFNKSQQDTLLPHVEDGTITLIGATTENPSFQVNTALLSRCRVIVLEKLESNHVEKILLRALNSLGACVYINKEEISSLSDKKPGIFVEKQAITTLSNLCDGDARVALNGLQMAVQSRMSEQDDALDSTQQGEHNDESSGTYDDRRIVLVNTEHIKEGLQRSHVLYDKTGEEHYNTISAMHKSIRGSDASAGLYWLARMLEGGENPLYVARRLVRIASEDIGLADPLALNQAVSAYQACHFIGMPECDVILAQCVTYMARAPKSVEVYSAYKEAKACIKEHKGPLPSVPLHLRNASTKLMKSLGYGKDYKYNPDYSNPVNQQYLPECLRGTDFFN